MADVSTVPNPLDVTEYIEDGARIAAILLIWGAVSAFFRYGVTEIGLPFESLWFDLGGLFALVGVLNAVLYLCYRTVDYWHAQD